MTFQEALEYLNLPANSSKQLIRKRYLELKKDYLKAIYNAPSDHFSALYRENLDKIEEAYNLMIETPDSISEPDDRIHQNIQKMADLIDAFLEKEYELTPETSQKLMHYIDRINDLQIILKRDPVKPPVRNTRWDFKPKTVLEKTIEQTRLGEPEPPDKVVHEPGGIDQSETTDHYDLPRWRWEARSIRNKFGSDKGKHSLHRATGQLVSRDAFLERWLIAKVLNTSFAKTSGSRRLFYNQLMLITLTIILILSAVGAVYMLFPLFT